MPIYKFRRISELDEAIRKGKITGEFTYRPDREYYRKVLMELDLLVHVELPRGVYKFKTLEEADRWLMKNLLFLKGKKEFLEKQGEL